MPPLGLARMAAPWMDLRENGYVHPRFLCFDRGPETRQSAAYHYYVMMDHVCLTLPSSRSRARGPRSRKSERYAHSPEGIRNGTRPHPRGEPVIQEHHAQTIKGMIDSRHQKDDVDRGQSTMSQAVGYVFVAQFSDAEDMREDEVNRQANDEKDGGDPLEQP